MTDTDPAAPNTAVGQVLGPRIRSVIYVVTAMLAAAYAVAEANIDLHWGVMAGYAAWNAGAGVLAASNTAKAPT